MNLAASHKDLRGQDSMPDWNPSDASYGQNTLEPFASAFYPMPRLQ